MKRKVPWLFALVVAVLACDGAPPTGPQEVLPPAGSAVAGNQNYAHVLMTCNTIVGAYEVDPARAAAALPGSYVPALHTSRDGTTKALVFLQTSDCEGTGNGEEIPPFGLSDAWLVIEGPFEVLDVPGAAVTLPTFHVYVLKAQTTSEWVKEHGSSIHFAKELVRELTQSGPAPIRAGSLVEMTGRGYAWTEFVPCVPPGNAYGECWMFGPPDPLLPVGYGLPPFPLGINIRGFINRGNGQVATKEMSCVMEVFGQGLIRLDVDPRSHLMRAGVFGLSQIGESFDSTARCDLLMKPARG